MALFKFPVFDSNEKLLQINKFLSNIGIQPQQRAGVGSGAISLPWAHEEGFNI